VDTEHASEHDLALLRAAFADGEALGWDAVHAFEGRWGIVLPEPYRTCVAEIADGYEGPPLHGLLPVGWIPSDRGFDRPERVLAKPFPLTEAWIWEDDERAEEELEALIAPVFDHGSIVLGADGCGMYWHLIVTGEHRGHVWCLTDVGASPFGAQFGATSGTAGFAGWVAHWDEGLDWYDA
jgi:hypothetical protein